RRPLVDPSREITPVIDAVRASLTSPQEAIRGLGYDPEAVLAQWQQFAQWLDELGLVSDIDPRRTTNQGARRAPPPPPPQPGGPRSRRPPIPPPLTNGHDVAG